MDKRASSAAIVYLDATDTLATTCYHHHLVLEQLATNELQWLDLQQPFCKLTPLGLRARHLHRFQFA
jgi:hypothetical protein